MAIQTNIVEGAKIYSADGEREVGKATGDNCINVVVGWLVAKGHRRIENKLFNGKLFSVDPADLVTVQVEEPPVEPPPDPDPIEVKPIKTRIELDNGEIWEATNFTKV